jgi:hypothetical protein
LVRPQVLLSSMRCSPLTRTDPVTRGASPSAASPVVNDETATHDLPSSQAQSLPSGDARTSSA